MKTIRILLSLSFGLALSAHGQIAALMTTNGVYTAPTASAIWTANFASIANVAYEALNANKYQATNSLLTAFIAATGGNSTNFYAGDGTYKQVTTNMVPGLVAALAAKANTATTLSGYGITDAEPINANKYQATNSALTVVASSGAVNWTNFTSLAIPADNNPTTDAAGEIALDLNNDFVEVYVNTASESRVIPTLQFRSYTIIDPDGLQAVEDAIPLLNVESQWAPFGITIKDIWIKIDAAVSYTATLEEWSDPVTYGSDIESLTISSGTEVKDDGTLSDASIAAGSIVFVDLPTTAANFLTVSFSFIINPGN